MKKIIVSILIIFLLTNVLYFNNTFAQENSISEYSISDSTTDDFSLTCFDFETQEVSTYTPSTMSLFNNSNIDSIEGSISENELISPNYVIGDKDHRDYVDVNAYPYRCIGFLKVVFDSGEVGYFSAFQAVKNNMLLTAGHSIYSTDRKRAVSITFFPGYNIDDSSHSSFHISRAYAASAWTSNLDNNNDWAILISSEPISSNFLGIRRYKPATGTIGRSVSVSGYPIYYVDGIKHVNYQFCASGTILEATDDLLRHDADMTVGQSGSPIYEVDGNNVFALGVNTIEVESHEGFKKVLKNYGVRFNDDFYQAILDLKAKY